MATLLITAILSFSFLYLSAAARVGTTAMSAYDVLRSHGLPIGLLPKGVKDFTVDEVTGWFEARLNQPCTANLETGIHYDAVINGTITYAQIASLSGVSAQELFLWFPVRGIRVDVPSSGLIYFDVGGVVYKQFSLSIFDTPPDCFPSSSLAVQAETVAAAAALAATI